eukprot:jgi/Astpho2/7388/fgenesh1_pg.00114_%23_33_t
MAARINEDHALQEVYTSKDVKKLLVQLQSDLMVVVDKELANASHTTGLLLRLLLCQAEQGGMQLEADTANLENEFLLQQVAGSEASALAKPASAFARRPHALRKIGAQTVSDPQVLVERDALKGEVRQLKGRLEEVQVTASSSLQEGTAQARQQQRMQADLAVRQGELQGPCAAAAEDAGRHGGPAWRAAVARRELESSSISTTGQASRRLEELSSAAESAKEQLNKTQRQLDAVRAELQTKALEAQHAEQQLGLKMSDTKQFQQMKRLMQLKSQEVTRLRAKLDNHEPQNVADADIEFTT